MLQSSSFLSVKEGKCQYFTGSLWTSSRVTSAPHRLPNGLTHPQRGVAHCGVQTGLFWAPQGWSGVTAAGPLWGICLVSRGPSHLHPTSCHLWPPIQIAPAWLPEWLTRLFPVHCIPGGGDGRLAPSRHSCLADEAVSSQLSCLSRVFSGYTLLKLRTFKGRTPTLRGLSRGSQTPMA